MNEYVQEIFYEEARKKAEEVAKEELKDFIKDIDMPVLREDFLEAECCWFFFKDRKIVIPLGYLKNWAYAVSKKGYLILIVDYSDDPAKLHEYLEQFSNHLKERGEC